MLHGVLTWFVEFGDGPAEPNGESMANSYLGARRWGTKVVTCRGTRSFTSLYCSRRPRVGI